MSQQRLLARRLVMHAARDAMIRVGRRAGHLRLEHIRAALVLGRVDDLPLDAHVAVRAGLDCRNRMLVLLR